MGSGTGGILSRADVILPAPPRREAIAAPQVVNFNVYGADTTQAAEIIRQAISGGKVASLERDIT